MNTVNQVT